MREPELAVNHQTTTETILKLVSTPLEALCGGLVAGLTKEGIIKLCAEAGFGKLSSGFLEQVVPAGLGGGAFALLGTAFRLWFKYLNAQKRDPDLSLKDFLRANKEDALEFGAKLWFVGGGTFAVYTSSTDVLAGVLEGVLNNSLNILVAGLTTSGGALALFALLRYMTALQLPVEKLYDIAAVFVGFSGGAFTVAKLAASVSLSPSQLFYISTFVPPAIGAATAFTARAGWEGLKAVYGYLPSCNAVGTFFSRSCQTLSEKLQNCYRPETEERQALTA